MGPSALLRTSIDGLFLGEQEYVVKRMIPMRNVVDVLEIDPQGARHPHCFRVVLSKRAMILSAESAEDVVKWVGYLKGVHKLALRRDASVDD
ncbi:hypothetical protein HK101_004743 [Irineochytrium annulatum]|nr:hypothetical protein HK101_004743 [Irineochytrium annulatum]